MSGTSQGYRCEGSRIEGNVTIGPECIIHPSAVIRAEEGLSITINAGCIVEESVVMETAGNSMDVGRGNIFQVGCRVQVFRVGDYNVFGVKSEVGAGAIVGDGCFIGAGTRVAAGESIGDEQVIFRNGDQGEMGTRISAGLKEEHRTSIELHISSLLAPDSRFSREHAS